MGGGAFEDGLSVGLGRGGVIAGAGGARARRPRLKQLFKLKELRMQQ